MRATRIFALCAALAAACGDDDGGGTLDAALAPDAPGAAVDAGAPDAAGGDLLDRLNAIPGLVATEQDTMIDGYRFFFIDYDQPVDHQNPALQRFNQRATLLVRDEHGPTVLFTSGYYLSQQGRRTEIARLSLANQLSVEHRYFPPSQPSPADWSYLTIEQSADDLHRLRTALGTILDGPWVNTGGSKGGMTALFSRRFYPDDFAGTVPYVAPISTAGPDQRYVQFVRDAGDDPACNQALSAVQERALTRRGEMLALLGAAAMAESFSFDRLTMDKGFEHVVLETPFVFWQYTGAEGCAAVPGASATAQDDYTFIDDFVGFAEYSDAFVEAYEPYFYQAGTQFGWPANDEAPLGALVLYPGTDEPQAYGPIGETLVYDAQPMGDILDWVASEGEGLLFIYGENDPWTAAKVDLGNAVDAYVYTVPGGTHGARIQDLATADRDAALATLSGWMGVEVTVPMMKPGMAPEPDPLDDERHPRR